VRDVEAKKARGKGTPRKARSKGLCICSRLATRSLTCMQRSRVGWRASGRFPAGLIHLYQAWSSATVANMQMGLNTLKTNSVRLKAPHGALDLDIFIILRKNQVRATPVVFSTRSADCESVCHSLTSCHHHCFYVHLPPSHPSAVNMIPGAYSARPSGDSRRESFLSDATSISEMTASDPALQLGPPLPARLHEASRSRWWDAEYVERVRTNCLRSPGKLAPLWLAELRDRHPTLAYVAVRPPPPPRPQGSRRHRAERDNFDDDASHASGFSSPIPGSPVGQSYMTHDGRDTRGHDEHSLAGFSEQEEFDSMSDMDLHRATPHPDAMYVFDTNQWVIVSVRPLDDSGDFPDALPRTGSRRAPMAFGSTNAAQRTFLQDTNRERDREPLCTAAHDHDEYEPMDPSTRTIRHHHLHTFPRSVPFPSFVAAEAGKFDLPGDRETASQRSPSDRRSHRTGFGGGSTYRSAPSTNLRVYDEMPPALDLTACCLCRTFIVVSPAMPGIIPPEYLVKLCEDRAIFWARRYGTAPRPVGSYNTEEEVAEFMEEGRPLSNPTADDLVLRAVETIAGCVPGISKYPRTRFSSARTELSTTFCGRATCSRLRTTQTTSGTVSAVVQLCKRSLSPQWFSSQTHVRVLQSRYLCDPRLHVDGRCSDTPGLKSQ